MVVIVCGTATIAATRRGARTHSYHVNGIHNYGRPCVVVKVTITIATNATGYLVTVFRFHEQ